MNITSHTDQGFRDYQEDRLICSELESGLIMAVFDGHGGDFVAEKASSNLIDIFVSEEKLALLNKTDSIDYSKLLSSVVAQVDKLTENSRSGSTMSLVFIPKSKNRPIYAYIAVIGDSPIVIADSADNIFIGPNHNVRENLKERKAAVKRGGHYYHKGYIFTPCGRYGLQLGRDLGSSQFGGVLSHTPDLAKVELGPESIVIIASDGVFDPAHKKSTVDQAKKFIEMVKNGSGAKDLVADALERETGDNATAIVFKMSN